MKQKQQIIVQVKGSGESKQKAFASALSKVQQEILRNNGNIILRLEPVDMKVISTHHSVTTEKFLFIFFPRKREVYTVTLDITVDMSFVDISQVEFNAD